MEAASPHGAPQHDHELRKWVESVFSSAGNKAPGRSPIGVKIFVLLVTMGVLCGLVNGAISVALRTLSFEVGILLAASFPGYVFVYIGLLLFAAVMGKLSREACGSGLPELKHILAGEMFPSDYGPFTSFRVLVAKTFGLISGASVAPLGREGPLVHTSACITNLLLSNILYFRDITDSQELSRQCFAASAAVGVASSFNAPVGGLLFSVEVTSTYYLISNYWKSFVAAVAASIVCNSILSAYKYNGSYSTGLSVRVLEMDEQLTTSSQLLAWEYLVFVGMAVGLGYGSSFYLQGVPSPFSQLPHCRVNFFAGSCLVPTSPLVSHSLPRGPITHSPPKHRQDDAILRERTAAVADVRRRCRVLFCHLLDGTAHTRRDGHPGSGLSCPSPTTIVPMFLGFHGAALPCSHILALPRVLHGHTINAGAHRRRTQQRRRGGAASRCPRCRQRV